MRIEMMAARHGDCLLVQYGNRRRTRRVLIDGGPIGAYDALQARIDALPDGDRRLELVVLTHVDGDHIEGLVRLLATPKPWPFVVKDVWFNGWRHLDPSHGLLGARQGEFFSALLSRRLEPEAWNGAFQGRAIVVRDDQPLPQCTLADGLVLTLLSPTPAKLETMRKAWKKELGGSIEPGDLDAAWELLGKQKRFLPGQGLLGSTPELDRLLAKQSRPDTAAANGASIALLAEFGRKSCLLLADAQPDAVTSSLRRLLKHRGLERLRVDACKVSHHGSKGNTNDELMSLIESPRFLFSTNGAQFGHPDREAVQRVIARSLVKRPKLYFNYLTDQNREWQSTELQRQLDYRAFYNPTDGAPFVVKL